MAFLQLQSAAYDEFFGWQQYVNLPLRHAEVQLSSWWRVMMECKQSIYETLIRFWTYHFPLPEIAIKRIFRLHLSDIKTFCPASLQDALI